MEKLPQHLEDDFNSLSEEELQAVSDLFDRNCAPLIPANPNQVPEAAYQVLAGILENEVMNGRFNTDETYHESEDSEPEHVTAENIQRAVWKVIEFLRFQTKLPYKA